VAEWKAWSNQLLHLVHTIRRTEKSLAAGAKVLREGIAGNEKNVISIEDELMEILTEVKETRKDYSSMFTFLGMPITSEITHKKHLFHAWFWRKSAKNNAANNGLSFLLMKLAASKDNLTKFTDSDEQIKCNVSVKMLQNKLKKFLEV
jgi:hypothetical protein